ncbi:hypothetical protein CPB85DRAFT_121806 [Mucidula mucida]|nr:hypothetical protein CPB85DRAFT_121806 [Mucidula mucida]
MAAQSTLKSCSSCQAAFTSYSQHPPFAGIPQAKAPFQCLTNLTVDTHSRGSSLTNKGNYTMALHTGALIAGLPIELIIMIFQYACNDIQCWLTALSLSLVSREWRSIAHALPELWTHIVVDIRRTGRLEMVLWYLHLSRDAPLDVKIDILGDEWESEHTLSLRQVFRNATRWQRADIRCSSEDLQVLKGIKKVGVSMLEILRFDVAGSGLEVEKCKAFWDAPRLREYAPGGVAPSECVVAWGQLKTVVIRDFFDEELFEGLRDAEGMEELVMDEECFFGTAFGAGMSIPLSASRLTMRSVPRLVDSTFMGAFVLPSLTVVDISIAHGSAVDSRFVPSLVGMLKRSECSLRELTLVNVPLDDEAVLNILVCTPQLRALALHEPAREHCITNAFLSTVSLPELRKLDLVWSYDACEERVLDLVERLEKLEAVVLGRRFGLELSETTVEGMNVLRKGGLMVSQW